MNVALIGTGYWGRNLARNFSELGALYCVCDHNIESARTVAGRYGVPILSPEQLFQDQSISAVAIATPAVTHFDLAKRSLDANKHVFVEKPMTLDLNHAKDLCKLAALKQKKLMVGHLLQYHPIFIKLKRLVHEGKLGQIQYLYSNRLDCGKIYPKKDVLWNLAPHDLSMMLSLIQATPTKISATSSCNLRDGIPDFATLHMNFPNKAKAHLFVSWLNPFKEHKLTVIGSQGMAVFDDTQAEWNKKLALYNHRVELSPDSIITEKNPPQFIEVEQSEPLKNECKHFIDCIEHNQTPITNGEEALKVIEILIQARSFITQ